VKSVKRLKTGKVLEHHGNGKVRFRGSYKDDEMHGAWTFYRLDGSKMRSGSFTLGKQSGVLGVHSIVRASL